ncbi:MAG: hypothetical protein LUQ32_00410 [Methanomicrobiales archaeon]|nr:hypothetical protein [Methanomicrobiales archaeon]
MLRIHRERGLSEIVGFILILAAIVIAVALFATFGIPAQGREGEIAHMNEVKDRFVEFKINVDSLWSNRQCGTAIGTSFTLGTGGGATTGSFSIIPILAPVKTSATLALNQRADYITIAQDSLLIVNDPAKSWNETGLISTSPSVTTITFNTTPKYFLINMTSPDILQKRGVHVFPGSGSGWEAWVNVTPVYSYSRRFLVSNGTGAQWAQIYGFWEINETRWNRTDITVSTKSGGTQLLQDFIVYRNITSSPSRYAVDLMNPAYGISTNLGSPQSIKANKSDATISATFLTNYSYWPTQTTQSLTMGSLEYRATNEYWIPQTYYYQMGGVFLEQNEGNTVKVPPAITFSMSSGIPVVKINQILLSGSGLNEGSGPIQVTSSVASITDIPMVEGNNTRFVNISVRTQSANASQMWLKALQTAADKAGFPTRIYTNNTAGVESFLNITADPRIYGVRLSLNRVIVNTAIQTAAPSVGG